MVVESRSLGEYTRRYYDAFRKLYQVRELNPTSGGLRTRYLYSPYLATWDTELIETKRGKEFSEEWFDYDAWGREIERIDALGNAITNSYDLQGQLVASSGAIYPVRHSYDTAGRRIMLQTTRDGTAWDTTHWLYDSAFGLVTNKLYADNSTVSYTHTADGKLATRTWARGVTTAYSYDPAQNLTSISYWRTSVSADATPAITFAYDSLQRLQSAANGLAAYSYIRNRTGKLTNEVATINGTLQSIDRNFDHYQRLITLSVNGNRVDYSYNSQGRLAAASNNLFTVAYSYTPDGYDAGYTLTTSGGMSLTREVERNQYRRQLVTTISNHINGMPQTPLRYTYDFLNRVTQRNQDTFGYNARSEVVAANIQPAHTNSYNFDDIGNNVTVEYNDTTTSYTANQLNQYTEILRGLAPSCELEYDLDGNLTNDGTFTYAWDAENRLIAAYSGSTLVISNAYDHQSRRVLKVTPTATHTFLYDGWNLVQETITTVTGTTTNHYIWGKDLSGTLQGAGGVGGLVAASINGSWYFPLYDNNGNITAYVDDTGSSLE